MDQLKKNWTSILEKLKTDYEISDISFDTWLKPLTIFSVDDQTLTILLSKDQNSLHINIIEKKFALPLKVTIAEMTGVEYDLVFIVPDQTGRTKAKTISKIRPVREEAEHANLNPNFTFQTFVVGNNNRFAHSASLAVAESPGEIYNPLFLHGGVGLGKTHLMHSVAHYILDNNPSMKVLYVSSETFTNEVIDGIRNGTMAAFREKYRSSDVLLVDDVQFIIGKESTQEEFFHTFNELHTAKKQIIISSDRPPKEMSTLEERIRSRFEWGLIADIGSPDYETRMAILRKKRDRDAIDLDDEILNYIAVNIKSNIRELEGALNKLNAFSTLENTEITMDIAIRELQNIVSPKRKREVTPQLILEVVSDHYNITVDQIMSKARSNDVSKPRQIAMYLCKNMTDLPLESIGKLIGGRDHSTVIHGVNRISEEIETNTALRENIETIRKKINPE